MIRFLNSEGAKQQRLLAECISKQYGESYLGGNKVYEWTDRFNNSRISFCDEQRKNKPSTSKNNDNIERVNKTHHSNWLIDLMTLILC